MRIATRYRTRPHAHRDRQPRIHGESNFTVAPFHRPLCVACFLPCFPLAKAFSKLESEVPKIVALASVIMALVVVAIGCVTGCIARAVSVRITKPVNQLAEVVHALNRMDFSQQVCARFIVSLSVLTHLTPSAYREAWQGNSIGWTEIKRPPRCLCVTNA